MLKSMLRNSTLPTRQLRSQFSAAISICSTTRSLSSTSSVFNSSSASSSSSSSSTPTPTSKNGSNQLLSHLDPTLLPSTIKHSLSKHKSLYEHLSTLPDDGVGSNVRQSRWRTKGLDVPPGHALTGQIQQAQIDSPPQCYWTITRVHLKKDGKHGKAWGRLTWRGKPVTPREKEERIRGDLKYNWESAT